MESRIDFACERNSKEGVNVVGSLILSFTRARTKRVSSKGIKRSDIATGVSN